MRDVATDRARAPIWTIAYWSLAVFLTAFGILALASIGAPFLLIGVVMIVLWPFRHRPRLFWPVMAGVVAFGVVFLLAAPFECERTGTLSPEGVEEEEHATCSSVIGVDYSGVGDWDPSYLPTILAGLGIGVVAAVGTRLLVARRLTARP